MHSQSTSPFLIDNEETHEVRYFAMLQDAVAISGDADLEGGTPGKALAYYNYLLNMQLTVCPIEFNLEKLQEKALKKRMNNLVNMNALLENLFKEKLLMTELGLKTIVNEIDKNCDEFGVSYLPSGYTNQSEGHFAGLKIRKLENGNYAFSCINQGDGMLYHRKIAIKGTKKKYSYQSEEYEINLKSEEGIEFLQRELVLRFDSQQSKETVKTTNIYSSDDLYGLLKLYGKEIPALSLEKRKEKAVTPQRTGTCPITNTNGIARDSLIDNDVNFKMRKRYKFVLKLRSLIDGFNKYQRAEKGYAPEVVEWALNEFSVRLNKQYKNILNEKEFIYCVNLHAVIKEKLDSDKAKVIRDKCYPAPYPEAVGEAPTYHQDIFDISKIKTERKPESVPVDKKSELTISKDKIRPEDIKNLLKFDEKVRFTPFGLKIFPFQEMYDLFNMLPHCSGLDKDEFWDNVPTDDLKDIITNLYKIIKNLKIYPYHSPIERARIFALSLNAYDIAAQLAPRYDAFKLDNRYTLGLDDVYSEQYFFTDPIAYYTVKRIANNFEQRAQNKERIFSNAVGYDNNKYDNTVHYVIRELLTHDQRFAVNEAKKKEDSQGSGNYSDEELFDYLLKNPNLRILDPSVIEVIALSATAHAVGNFTEKYIKSRSRLWCFSKNKFHHEVKRQSQFKGWTSNDLDKHLPDANNMGMDDDFSENTIYHPYDNLLNNRNATKERYSSDVLPYQPQLSGSIKPDSVAWQPQKNQQFLYEELNEDFRSIECSPNLQVLKTLDWATNNLDKLENKDVRIRINELIFQYGKLDNAFANQFATTIPNIQRFLSVLQKYCQEEGLNNNELLIWAANLSHDLRYHLEAAAKFYELPIDKVTLPDFKVILLNRIKSETDENVRSRLGSQLVRQFRNMSPLSVDDCCMVLAGRLAANLGDEALASEEAWKILRDEVMTTITSEKDTSIQKLNELLSISNLTSISKWSLVDSELHALGKNLFIDLHTGSIQEKNEYQIKKERTLKTIDDNKALFDSLQLPEEYINKTKLLYSYGKNSSINLLKSDDGRFEFTFTSTGSGDRGTRFDIGTTYQSLTVEDIHSRFKLLKKNEISKFFGAGNPFESDKQAGTHYQYWQSDDDNDLIFVRQGNDDVAYSYSKDYDLILITIKNLSDIDLTRLEEISSQNNKNPILINFEGKISLYGYYENKWMLNELDNTNNEFIVSVTKLPFPEIKTVDLTFLNKMESRLDEIKRENATDDRVSSIEEIIEDEKKKIKEKERIIAVANLNTKSLNDEIRQQITKFHTPVKNKVISQLKINSEGEWHRSGKELLNLIDPQTGFEREWAARLSPIFGLDNVRCITSRDKDTRQLERIEHLFLGLSFTLNDKRQLMCNEVSGFYLSEQRSIEALHGLPSIIILENENDSNEKKYFIPAFSLDSGKTNNALNFNDVIDYGSLCNKDQTYYQYALNSQNELVSTAVEGSKLSVEANIYLAILYRSLGDYKRAIKYLDNCKKYENIDVRIGAIANQIYTRPMRSPTGVAFDLKLAFYLKEHQLKWSKDKRLEPFKPPQFWDKLLESQIDFYNKTYSSYKSDIAIIPTYCRLTKHELSLLEPPEANIDKVNTILPPSNRLQSVSKLSNEVLNKQEDYWKRHVDRHLKNSEENARTSDEVPDKLSTLRLYSDSRNSAQNYLLKHFSSLFMDAISSDEKRRDNFNRTLFALIQNDPDPEHEFNNLAAVLIFSRDYPEYFKDFKPPVENIELIREVGDILNQHRDELYGKSAYLFTFEDNPYLDVNEKPLPSDFVPESVKFNIASIPNEQEFKHPMSSLSSQYFTSVELPVAEKDFTLELSGLPEATLLERKIFDHYQAGHEENKTKMKPGYSASTDKTLIDLKGDLQKLQNEDEQKLKKLERLLFDKANLTPLYDSNASMTEKAEAYNLLQARISGQKHEIAISDLFTAFLEKNPSLLTEQNPYLKQNDIEQLFADLATYALLSSRVSQSKEALKIIGDKTIFTDISEYQKQLVGGILDKHRAYNINDFPEFLVYEYATQRLLRDDQVHVLKNLIILIEQPVINEADMHHALLQFAAGGGKTSVLIPILAHRFSSKGFLPVIINTNELYEIGLEDVPKNLRACFKQNIEVIERELEHKWTKVELDKLLRDLNQWRTEGKCLLIKSVTWHSINIAMKSAYFNYGSMIAEGNHELAKANLELAKAAQNVLDFFKTQTIKLEDESHIVSDPMQQSIKTDGKPRKLPNSQINLLLHCYDYLMDRKAKSSSMAKDAGIISNRKRPITKDELNDLQIKLSRALSEEEVFKDIPQNDIINYFLQKDKTRPPWLENLSNGDDKQRELADLVVLARAFTYTHLPHILSLQYEKDFGTSIHDGDLTAAPKHEGNSVSSHFGDHTLLASLTIQLYEQRGLLPDQIDELIDAIVDENKSERLWNYDLTKPTQAEQWLLDLGVFASYKELTLAMKNIQTMKNMLKDDNKFAHNSAAIQKYLSEFALPQIKVPEKRITSTASEMQAGFVRSILFSATPGLPEIYAAFLEHSFLEKSFEAQVIDTLLKEERNKKAPCLIKKYQTPDEFFGQFSPELLSTMTTLIDRGSLLTDFKVENIIKSYLKLDKSSIPTQTAAFFSESGKDARQKMQLKSKSDSVKEVDIPGSALVDELKRQDLNPEEFMLFLFLDLSKTTGTDIKRPYKDRAGLTVGKEQTVTQTIQAAMRERQLLEPDAQSITWIMFQSLYRETCTDKKSDVFDPRQVFYWMIKNEARQVENKIINRAYQGIFQAISELAWNQVRQNPESIAIYREALEEIQQLSAFKIYEVPSTTDKAETVLRNHVDNLLTRFKFTNKDIPPATNKRIEKIINETASLIAQLEDPPKHHLGAEVEQEMQQEQKQKKEQQEQQRIKTRNDSVNDFVFEVERYNIHQDNLNIIFNINPETTTQRYQTPRLPGCENIKQPELRLCQNHFTVTQGKKMEGDSVIEELKPIKNLLVRITPDNQLQFIACTETGSEYFSDQISKNKFTEKESAYAIIGRSGAIYNSSNNISMNKLIQLIQGEDCQKMLAYIHFLNGKISNPVILSQIAKDQGWSKDQYERLVNGISNVHVSQHPVSLSNNEVLEACCGWNNKKSLISTNIQRTVETVSTEPQQILRPIKTLDNYIEKTHIPIKPAEHALGDDLLGKNPQPININPEQLKIKSQIKRLGVF